MADTAASRIMQSILTCAIRLYPPEKRAWGEAILAESNSVTEFSAALSWTLGGLMIAFRSFFSCVFRRSAAKNEPVLTGAQIPPPLPWTLVLACLVISGALLFVPDLRQGLSVIFSSWRDEFNPGDETAMWEKIGGEAENRGDAAAMAVASMRLSSPEGGRFDEAVRMAEHAVAKDPGLTWTYYFLAQRRSDSRFRGSLHQELTQHLQDWDPQNAVPYLTEADEIAQTGEHDPQWRGRGSKEEEIARIRGRDPRWLELMGRAFAAPVYDTYFARRLDLDLQVMQRLGVIEPQLATTAHPSADVLPSISNWREYADLRLARGEETERTGKWEDAASDYWAVAQFGQRVCLGHKAEAEVELLFARDLQERSFKHLQPVLLKLGRAQEAQSVAYAAQLQHAENEEMRAHDKSEMRRLLTFSLASGLLVHLCAILSAASVLLITVALFTFTVKRTRSRFVCLNLTYAPLLLVLTCTSLLFAYHPYAAYYRSYLANPSGQDHESILNVLLVSGIPGYVHSQTFIDNSHIYFWCAIIAIGAIGIWLALRAGWRTMRQSHAH